MFPFSIILGFSGPQKRWFVPYHFGYEPNRYHHFWTPSITLLGVPWHALYSHHVYLVWRVLIIGSEMTIIWVLKKKIPPAAGTLIGNLLKRRAGLRRPTASGLNCGRRTPSRHVLYSHHVYLIYNGLSFKSEMVKNTCFETCCLTPPKGSLCGVTSGTNPIVVVTSEHRNLTF